jgi:hypothetical protein
MKARDGGADPLESLAVYRPDPEEQESSAPPAPSNRPISPLGPPTSLANPGLTSFELLLQDARRQIEELQAELAAEREARRALERQTYLLEAAADRAGSDLDQLERERAMRVSLEREIAVMETELKHAQALANALEGERTARMELERRVGALEWRAEKMAETAAQLEEERQARVNAEREQATLEIEVQHARKLEQLLAEERQARASAQMRASSAEARLAQLEGELSAGKKGGSVFGRGRP